MQQPIAVFGGYGVFGRQIVKALLAKRCKVTIVGRCQAAAQALANQLGGDCNGAAADATNKDACLALLQTHGVAVHCAGPFQSANVQLLSACLRSNTHYVDITENRQYAQAVCARSNAFQTAGLTAAYGCCSLPGLSGAAALVAAENRQNIQRVRLTLFIGNRNSKGRGAVRAALSQVGKSIATPTGVLRGFGQSESVVLPAPFGRRRVTSFESPEYDCLADRFPNASIAVKVGFESHWVNAGFGLLGVLRMPLVGKLATWAAPWAALAPAGGHSGGVVMAEAWDEHGAVSQVAVHSACEGQKMAVTPAVLVAEQLAREESSPRGAVTAYDFLGARALLEQMRAAGFEVVVSSADRPIEAPQKKARANGVSPAP